MILVKKFNIPLLAINLINALFLSIGHAFNHQFLLLGSLLLFSGITLFSKKKYFLPIMLFYLPWSPILKMNPGSHTLFTLIVPVVFIQILLNGCIKKTKFEISNIFFPLLLTVYTLFVKLLNGASYEPTYLFFIMMIFFIPIYFRKYKDEIDFETCILFLTTGVLGAAISAKILTNFPHMLEYINIYEWKRVGLIRLSGFYGDANFYSVHILVSIASLIITLRKTSQKKWASLQIVMIMALLYFGMLSVSKMFIFCIVLMALVWVLCFLIEKGDIFNKLRTILTFFLVLVVISANNLFSKQLNLYFIRFGMVSDTQTLTTGRIDLVVMYLEYLFSSIKGLFWGIGLTPEYLNGSSSHNTFVQILYQVGILGTIIGILWCGMVYSIISNKIKLGIFEKYYLLILVFSFFLPWLSLEMLFFDEFFYLTVLVLLARNYLAGIPNGGRVI
ncbi:hypothetical protein [Neobacillus kokaensis]|uniref:O-antigen ligase domain-containing protein n=1 Tax=Neobacillus kokaensis TaxID=2759023 RepID=A0ABQ3MYH2_9BACI|nr:hypothetical protein [Neobacillus kokaensis]GHH97718.1 hypothetical protein AM1BK_12610 [Neobacillus kokaensis]